MVHLNLNGKKRKKESINFYIKKEMKLRINRVLTNDPGLGVARHVDAGYEKALDVAIKRKLKVPSI